MGSVLGFIVTLMISMAAQWYYCHPAKLRWRSLKFYRENKDKSLLTMSRDRSKIFLHEKTFMQPNLHYLICLVMITLKVAN